MFKREILIHLKFVKQFNPSKIIEVGNSNFSLENFLKTPITELVK